MRKVTDMAIHKTCDGVRRRDFLKAGAIGTTGLTLANFLRMADAGEQVPEIVAAPVKAVGQRRVGAVEAQQ